MSRSRRTPRQVRRRYFVALTALPVLAEAVESTDPDGLPVLAVETIGGRTLRFATLPAQPRLRVTFADIEPAVLGSIIGLDGDRPELRVATPVHMDWSATHSSAIADTAARIWAAHQRACDR
ncbi:hypothetical protein L0U85_00550 [Glycomyces sp. L485]|uniref:hypothetical protein n=1 Tax=Glycomyces sp. L485 TaxID=2909235 RepID=UPI001F4B972A|nr:hypothetical protein [Glycomyces sp. L485]MCH7229358.1 hypothetical protein [Glycomyces sp. L485]